MKRSSVWLIAVSVIFLLSMFTVSMSFADSPASSRYGAWSVGIPEIPDIGGYSTDAVVMLDLKGKVTKIEAMKGVKNGLQMRFKSEKGENYLVYMGPKWFIENQRIGFKAGDDVEVRGRRFDSSTITATDISKGDLTMKLRNEEDGLPSWECCFPRKTAAED